MASLSEIKELKVLFLNTFLMPPGMSPHKTIHKDARLHYLCDNIIGDYDILLFCEVFNLHFMAKAVGCFGLMPSFHRQHTLIQRARDKGFKYHCTQTGISLPHITDGGLIILSRFPIDETDSMIFSDSGPGYERFMAKGVLYAQIGGIDLFVSHLQSDQISVSESSIGSGEEIRKKQIVEMKKFISKYAKSDRLCLLAADMNIDATVKLDDNIVVEKEEYKNMIAELGAIDLFYATHDYFPVTYGARLEDGRPMATDLTCQDEIGACETLDYFLRIDHKYSIPGLLDYGTSDGEYEYHDEVTKSMVMGWIIKNINIEKFQTPMEDFSQISDHFGISFTLKRPFEFIDNGGESGSYWFELAL